MADTDALHGRHILLGLSGGIACYKSAELLRGLVKAGATVQVVMTPSALEFIGEATMQALSNRPVFTDTWDARAPNRMAHINLSREADAVLIAPASADLMARLAQGRADDLLSLLCLARPAVRCPLLIAPAMNREMWSHPATQRNARQLAEDGAVLLGPDAGDQACGEVGDGRMLEPETIVDAVIAHFQPKLLRGRSLLITAGPTFEPIDPVRGITNLSSGKMGFSLARAAAEAGARVTLVAGPVHLPTPIGVQRIDVTTARQMHDAVLPLATSHDVFVATAAVADWRPASLSEQKIKKNGSKVPPVFELTENADILAAVARIAHEARQRGAPARPYCVGFAAESHDLLHHAREKLERKHLPMIVGNLGPATFGRDDNSLLIVDAQGHRQLPDDGRTAGKLELARELMAEIARRLDAAGL